MPFEEYVRPTGRMVGGQGPMVSICTHGSFYLSPAAVQQLGETDHVILGFDPDRGMIAIRAAREDEPGARRIRHKDPGAGLSLMCKPFFADQAIVLGPETVRFTPELEGRWLAFGPVRSNRVPHDRLRQIIATATA